MNWKTWIKKLNQQQLTIQLNFIWWWCIVVFIFSLGSLIPLKCSILIARPDVYNRSLLVVFCSCFNLKPPFPTRYKSRSGAYTKYLLLIRWIVYPVCCRFCILLLFFFIIIFACFRFFFVRGCIFVCSSYCSKILQTLLHLLLYHNMNCWF